MPKVFILCLKMLCKSLVFLQTETYYFSLFLTLVSQLLVSQCWQPWNM